MIYLNIGSNLPLDKGGRETNILKAINYLKKLNIKLIKISSFYETPSYPNNSDPKFINLCIKLESDLKANELLNEIKKIEKKLGRIRTKKNEPRTCDIDIIDFNGEIIKNDELVTPHPMLHLRNFVIYPLKEIEPNWSHPIFKKNAKFFINKLSQKSRIEITRLQKNVNIQL